MQLAARAGLALKTVYDIERGRVTPQRATVFVLAATLGCKPDDIYPPTSDAPVGSGGVAKTSVEALDDAPPG